MTQVKAQYVAIQELTETVEQLRGDNAKAEERLKEQGEKLTNDHYAQIRNWEVNYDGMKKQLKEKVYEAEREVKNITRLNKKIQTDYKAEQEKFKKRVEELKGQAEGEKCMRNIEKRDMDNIRKGNAELTQKNIEAEKDLKLLREELANLKTLIESDNFPKSLKGQDNEELWDRTYKMNKNKQIRLEREVEELRRKVKAGQSMPSMDVAEELGRMRQETGELKLQIRRLKGGITDTPSIRDRLDLVTVNTQGLTRKNLKPNTIWKEGYGKKLQTTYCSETIDKFPATSGMKFTKWFTNGALYEHVETKPDPDGRTEMVIETTGENGYMESLKTIFREGRVYGEKEKNKETAYLKITNSKEEIEKEIVKLREIEGTWKKNQDTMDPDVIKQKDKLDRLLLGMHRHYTTYEDLMMKEINGDVVEHILADGDEEEEPIRASTPLPGAVRGRKQSFGNQGAFRGTSIHSRGSSTHSRGSTTIRLVPAHKK